VIDNTINRDLGRNPPLAMLLTHNEARHIAANITKLSEPLRKAQGPLAWVYSITLSARATNVAGTVRPSALAVLRLITSSNCVGCQIGRLRAAQELHELLGHQVLETL
jgi:hypothetical protein